MEAHHLVAVVGVLNWEVVVVAVGEVVVVGASRLRAGVAAGLMRLVEGEVGYHILPSRNSPCWTSQVGHPCPEHWRTCSPS